MDIFIKTKNGNIEEDLADYTATKLAKLEKFNHSVRSIIVTFTKANSRKKDVAFKADFMLTLPGQALHIMEEASSFTAAVDCGIETLKKQLSKLTTKRVDKQRLAAGTAKVVIHTATNRLEAEALPVLPRVMSEQFSVKPLALSDAIKELEAGARSWLVFVNQTGVVNCIYRRDDSNYGLLEPEGAS